MVSRHFSTLTKIACYFDTVNLGQYHILFKFQPPCPNLWARNLCDCAESDNDDLSQRRMRSLVVCTMVGDTELVSGLRITDEKKKTIKDEMSSSIGRGV